MSLQKIVTTLKKRIISPRVYAIELVSGVTTYLFMCVAYTLDEAININVKKLQLQLNNTALQIRLGKYTSKDVLEIVTKCTDVATDCANVAVEKDDISDKNVLMKKIIDTKNIELYHENLSIFTEPEKKMLDEKLSSKS